jgi:Flp pilus assembly pilin Flp
MRQKTTKLFRNCAGQGLTEYLILVVLIAVVCIGAAKTFGGVLKEKIELAKRHVKSEVSLER